MIKSIADAFNDPKAVYNDPLYEIHNPVQNCDSAPENEEYDDFLNYLDIKAYPLPENKTTHNIINPLNGALKPIIKYKY